MKLRYLNVSTNHLSFIDLAELPNLQTLNLDKNSIASIESLSSLKHLQTLSWREQTFASAYGFSEIQYQHCHEVCNLYLSGNPLSTFTPSTPFLNLHHLELASTGLQSFSPDLGLQCPNLRTLNSNYNAIRELRPLLGIVKLQNLFIAGNRISRLRRTVSVLQHFGKTLTEVDLRYNPLTVGFYTPQEPGRKERCVALQMQDHVDDDRQDLEAQRLQAFLLPALDREQDNTARERLDEDTKIRRRVHEVLMVKACQSLQRLDGLDVDKKLVQKEDGVWKRLQDIGVLIGKGKTDRDGCNE